MRERLVFSLFAGVTLTTCGGIWWMKKKDPALLLAKEYRDEYRQTAASRKEQRLTEKAFADQQAFTDKQNFADQQTRR